MSGRGLHLILWFDEPVELTTDCNRRSKSAALWEVLTAVEFCSAQLCSS
jgi:hypothetical protein